MGVMLLACMEDNTLVGPELEHPTLWPLHCLDIAYAATLHADSDARMLDADALKYVILGWSRSPYRSITPTSNTH